ncbi:hypothetical protein SC09_Contig28orf00285 [Bacillus subtilis]|uniref:Uncharacterized protein n=1 Tax=Bacillus subtilis TaxID=1423 RepID=A0A0D1ILZ7_BACIU|nr:hypothetical protein SC09_Contig28orf00285 [Bacillus subtilis]
MCMTSEWLLIGFMKAEDLFNIHTYFGSLSPHVQSLHLPAAM